MHRTDPAKAAGQISYRRVANIMGAQATSIAGEPGAVDRFPSLTQQIAEFTASAEKRLPAGYVDAFRALVARLAELGLGGSAPSVLTHS
jgi:hypothetical protein